MTELSRPANVEPADWEQTPLSVQLAFAQLQAEVVALHAQVAELAARLNLHSGNSSRPPSADPPSAPKRQPRPPRGKRRGAQEGHPGAHRSLLPPEAVGLTLEHHPTQCPHCLAGLAAELPSVLPPERRQIIEVPAITPDVTEHQLFCVACPNCARMVRAELPADVPPGAFGPNLIALIALLHGRFRLSEREVANLLSDLFAIDISLGSVSAGCVTVSAALEPAYAQVTQTLQQQAVLNVDETGWKMAGKKRWLWVAVSAVCTLFMVATGRNATALKNLLGNSKAIVGSDRCPTYDVLSASRRQLCWAHLVRNITWFCERDGAAKRWGEALLGQTTALFRYWHEYRAGRLNREELQRQMAPLQQRIKQLLLEGQQLPLSRAVSMSGELLERWDALWTFIYIEGVEPTNNTAERALRPAVLWRKGCFGTQSEAGNRFVERLLTVRATCEQQNQHLWNFLSAAVSAYWADQPSALLFTSTP